MSESFVVDTQAGRVRLERLQVTCVEAAAMLGISRSSIYLMLERGELPSTGHGRLRRIPVAALRRWVEEHTTQG